MSNPPPGHASGGGPLLQRKNHSLMTDSMPKPSHELPEGQIFTLQLVNEGGAWKARVRWSIPTDQITEDLKMDACIAVDAVMRDLSDRYRDAMAYLDEVADLGFQVREAPPSLERVIARWVNPETGAKHAAQRRAPGA